tara:strand:+ start:1080 stop:1325 length:246 start_codon:yes stop_codon:yes gene_type:complete
MKAKYSVGDLIRIPIKRDTTSSYKPALVTEVREWEDEHSFNDPPITWDYLVLTAEGEEILFEHGDFLCCASELMGEIDAAA